MAFYSSLLAANAAFDVGGFGGLYLSTQCLSTRYIV
jgi:hypothetical protein